MSRLLIRRRRAECRKLAGKVWMLLNDNSTFLTIFRQYVISHSLKWIEALS
ncbi:hypothetical protein SAMN05661091_2518 [Paenibacillus uliginis N3/975]|uniref:Uncharacterized protein n=1 Tax=Paenibacillus uliginis N3/975 TaxID=1313296 RepID=A0A1X7HEF5_9BACL|nr:hypothetical protein SAMN05661091_2518 [Paenibacillus uliginis N3/975]